MSLLTHQNFTPILRRFLRFAKFGLASSTGTLVSCMALWLLHDLFDIALLYASPLAIWLAVTNNFFWNDRWTWRDKRCLHSLPWYRRLLRYYLTASAGAFLNCLVLIAGSRYLGLHYLAANLLGSFCGSVLNFTLSGLWIFHARKSVPIRP